jgi:hypothetical protein
MPSIPLARMATIFKKLPMGTWLFGHGNRVWPRSKAAIPLSIYMVSLWGFEPQFPGNSQ